MSVLDNIYGLVGKEVNENILSVDNEFVRQLYSLAENSIKNFRIVSVVLDDGANKRGEISQRGVPAREKSVIDICKLTPLAGVEGCRTLLDEVAYYRAAMMNLPKDFWATHKKILFVDYLLSCSLCYVEVFHSTTFVDKFLATRNKNIVGVVGNLPEGEISKFVSHLTTYETNYREGKLKYLKVTVNKNSVKVSKPRGFLDFGNVSIKVTPLFLLSTMAEGINELLTKHIILFNYIKDNLTEREFVSTLSPEILASFYDYEHIQKVFSNTSLVLLRGYIRVPELGLSRYDETGVRALNITRITSLRPISKDEVDTRFIDVDLNVVLPYFEQKINSINNVHVLSAIYEELTGSPSSFSSISQLKSEILGFVHGQYALGTTTVLKSLHLYLMSRKNIFSDYNDGKPNFPSFIGGFGMNFNLGVEE